MAPRNEQSHVAADAAGKGGRTFLGMKEKYWYIDGVAYDFTQFLHRHPGGQWALKLGQGRECMGLIQSYHLKLPSQDLLDKYRLPDSEQPNNKKFLPLQKISYDENGFYATVKREAVKYFEENGISHKAPWTHMLMTFLNMVFMIVTLYKMIFEQSYVFALVHGVLRALLVVQTTHGASHFSYSMNPTVNRWLYRIGTVLIGLWAPTTWDIQHVVAHHIYTNEWPYDSDSAFPLKSIFANQRRFWYHKYQHLYMWVVYSFTIPLVMLNSIKDIIIGRQVLFRLRMTESHEVVEAWATSILGVLYLIVPFLFVSFWPALKLSLCSSITSSLFFSMQFVVNHEVDGIIETSPKDKYSADNPAPESTAMLPPSDPAKPIDWGAYQLANSLTFAPGNKLALEMAGGLNTQVEHHLFPGVHYSHYTALGKIIQQQAKKFGLTYHSKPNLLEAVVAHYKLLKNPPRSIRGKHKNKRA